MRIWLCPYTPSLSALLRSRRSKGGLHPALFVYRGTQNAQESYLNRLLQRKMLLLRPRASSY